VKFAPKQVDAVAKIAEMPKLRMQHEEKAAAD